MVSTKMPGSQNDGMSPVSRRTFLAAAGTTATAVFAGFPSIIGAAPLETAKDAFKGEALLVVSWSGNYELVFREQIVEPFNAMYGTRVETVGGWDQMINQIVTAPADKPPFDITVTEEYAASTGLAQGVFVKTDRSKIPNLSAVQQWFFETRPATSTEYGIPFGGGTSLLLANRKIGFKPDSWAVLWKPEFAGKVTMDAGAPAHSMSVPALLSDALPGIEELYDWPTHTEPLIQELEKIKMARWYRDAAEQANIMLQEDAILAMSYSSDAFTFEKQAPGEFYATVPKEGASAWTDWYYKVRGTRHSDLADFFMNYLLEKETQDRFLAHSKMFVARKDVAIPAHWEGYPQSDEDFRRKFQLITMDGWARMLKNWEAIDARFQKAVQKS